MAAKPFHGALLPRVTPGGACGLVGFDDFELADRLRRPVTVVAYDAAGPAGQAVDLLFARLAGSDARPVRRIVHATRGAGDVTGRRRPGEVALSASGRHRTRMICPISY